MRVKSVPISLDKERRLCFNFNAFAELQRQCGISFIDLQKFVGIAAQGGNKKASDSGLLLPLYELRGFIWAGLLDETPDITLKEVGDILDDCLMEKPGDIGEALLSALMESSFFKGAEKKAEGPKPVIPKTGAKKTT